MSWDIGITAFTIFFVIIDPLGIAPIFASLTYEQSQRRRMVIAFKSVVTTGGILLFFALVGDPLLSVTGISLSAFSVAGGILLFLIGLEMVFEKSASERYKKAEQFTESSKTTQSADPSIVPLAIPLMAGPGAIASILLLMTQYAGATGAQVTVLLALIAVLLTAFVIYTFAAQLLTWAGDTVAQVVSRIMGVILCALAVQYVIDGLQDAFLS